MNSCTKIVLLEDDRISSTLARRCLESAGFEVLEAGEGRLAIEFVLKERPALLIADVMLPDMKGSDVVRALKETEYGNRVQTLFLTSILNKEGPEEGPKTLTFEGEPYPALAKPFTPPVLVGVVTSMIGDPQELVFSESVQ